MYGGSLRIAVAWSLTIVICQSASAQHFRTISDQQRIEFALDMIRRGVQQEDTMKIAMALADQVAVAGRGLQAKDILISELQTVFDNASLVSAIHRTQ